jgi:hypothetical protein
VVLLAQLVSLVSIIAGVMSIGWFRSPNAYGCRDAEDYSIVREVDRCNTCLRDGTIVVASFNFNVNLIRVNHGPRNRNGSHVFHPCRIGKSVLKKEQLDVL